MLWSLLLSFGCFLYIQTRIPVVHAQESPFVTVEKFSEFVPYRTNVCQRQLDLSNQETELRDALRGLNLTIAITNYYQVPNEDKFFTLKRDKIVEGNPGLFVVILDEVARRAGFSWRNTFTAIDPVIPEDNKTWTELLEWEVAHFDVAVDYWARSVDRMSKGISFPHGWYDGSIVLATSETSLQKEALNMWTYLLPFSGFVWIAIGAAIIFTGLVYFCLERFNNAADERDLWDKPMAAIFFTALTCTGHFEFKPGTHAARILSFSWTFWALIMTSAYTANMASFLVSQNKVQLSVGTIDDASQRAIPVCVQRGAVIDGVLSEKYPQLILVRKDTHQEVFQGLRESWYRGGGGCGILAINLGTLELYQSQAATNYDCTLSSEKRVVLNLPAGFATAVDAGEFCTSLISYVLDLHLKEMRSDGFIDAAWRSHVQSLATVDCESPSDGAGNGWEEDNVSLGMHDMGGIFITHGILSIIALLFALCHYCYTKHREPTKRLRPLFPSMRNKDPKLEQIRQETLERSNHGQKGQYEEDTVQQEHVQTTLLMRGDFRPVRVYLREDPEEDTVRQKHVQTSFNFPSPSLGPSNESSVPDDVVPEL
jgi:hypothetical protein